MKKAQIVTLSVCALGGISLLAAAWILLRGVMRFNEAAGALSSAKQQLTDFYREPIFPSAENVQREESNTGQLSLWFADLTAALRKGNVTSDERSPSRFVGILEKTRERLMRDAQAAGTELPPAFAFGFDLYTGTGALPRPDDVPRLTEQLVLVNRVCKILFDNRVKTLRAVERGLFEEGAAAVSATATPAMTAGSGRPSASGRDAPSSAANSSVAAILQPGIIPEGGLFGKYRFAFEFNAKETALIAVLNALASSPAFTVVNVVRIVKDVPVLMPAAPEPAAEPPVAAAPEPVHLGPNFPVCGLEMEIPMRVRIELDVFKFKGDSDESGG